MRTIYLIIIGMLLLSGIVGAIVTINKTVQVDKSLSDYATRTGSRLTYEFNNYDNSIIEIKLYDNDKLVKVNTVRPSEKETALSNLVIEYLSSKKYAEENPPTTTTTSQEGGTVTLAIK